MDINAANEAVTGGPGTLELGGVTYLVGQPDDRTFAAVAAWLRGKKKLAPRPLQIIAADLQLLSPEDRAVAIRAAVESQVGGDKGLTEGFAQESLMTPDGAAFLAWLLIRKEQPDVKLEAIRPHVTEENAVEILAALMTASGLEAVAAGKAGPAGSKAGNGSAG